jgi:hypothetical protein
MGSPSSREPEASLTAENEPEAVDETRSRPLDAGSRPFGEDARVFGAPVEALWLRGAGEKVCVAGEAGEDLEANSCERHFCFSFLCSLVRRRIRAPGVLDL